MSRTPKGDPVHGVMLLDKPEGMTSNAALQRVRRLLNARKAGHTGTLDPMATGLLPLCFGDATKFSADLLHADKGYVARVKLGATTSTGDAEGEILETRTVEADAAAVAAAAQSFLGEIEQVPPMHSALKRGGRPLYELARRGEVVEREPRRVFVRSIFAADFDGESFTLACVVSKGTYIRVLAEDIGRALGCGAHLTALRRTRVGNLTLDKAVTIEALEALGTPEAVRAKLTPSDALLSTLARVDLTAPQAERFLLGQRLRLELPADPRVRVYDAAGALLGTASVSERGVLSPVRLIAH